MSPKFISIILVITIYCVVYYWANQLDVYQIWGTAPGPTVLIVGGTHGNEPAGSVAMEEILKTVQISLGKLVFIPRANRLGLALDTRWLPHRLYHRDLNRNYPREEGELPLDWVSQQIVQHVDNADFVLDLHEGWGYNRLTPESLGSGIYPGNTQEAIRMAHTIALDLNKTIPVDYKKFVVGLNSHPELKSLRSYCVLKGKHYILVETTGQNDIQPMEVRKNQHIYIICQVLSRLNM